MIAEFSGLKTAQQGRGKKFHKKNKKNNTHHSTHSVGTKMIWITVVLYTKGQRGQGKHLFPETQIKPSHTQTTAHMNTSSKIKPFPLPTVFKWLKFSLPSLPHSILSIFIFHFSGTFSLANTHTQSLLWPWSSIATSQQITSDYWKSQCAINTLSQGENLSLFLFFHLSLWSPFFSYSHVHFNIS